MRTLLILPILALPACASQPVNAPSLLPRAIESRSTAEPTTTSTASVSDPALDAQISARTQAFTRAASAFDSAQPSIAARVARARGALAGSESWLDVQQALGELQQTRTAVEAAMAELEALAIERASAGQPPYAALETVIATSQAELDRQSAAEAALKASVPN